MALRHPNTPEKGWPLSGHTHEQSLKQHYLSTRGPGDHQVSPATVGSYNAAKSRAERDRELNAIGKTRPQDRRRGGR
jgi:hypothetical protein